MYNKTDYPEVVTVVCDGDAVLMPSGYHPNVSVPGHRICFLWAMAAHCEGEDRHFGVVNVQRGFDQGASGLEARPQKVTISTYGPSRQLREPGMFRGF